MKIILTKNDLNLLEEKFRLFLVDKVERFNSDKIEFDIPENVRLEPYVGIYSGFSLPTVGAFTFSRSSLNTNFYVGRYCSIAKGLSVLGFRHPYERISSSGFTYGARFRIFKDSISDFSESRGDSKKFIPVKFDLGNQKILIGNDVWIGSNVTLKPGITIGDGAIIAANSLVTKDIPSFSIWGGVPAKLIKFRFPQNTINHIMNVRWFDYAFPDFYDMNILDPDIFCEQLSEKVANGSIKRYMPVVLKLQDFLNLSLNHSLEI